MATASQELDPELKEMGFNSVAESNEAFIKGAEKAENGLLKNGSAGTSNFIRSRLRENGFSRNILRPEPVTDDMFDRQLESDMPAIVEDMEPDSPAAKSIAFNDGPDTAFYRGRRYMVRFSKITTPEFVKNIDELRTYKMDLRQVITDNALKDMETEEDGRLINTVDRIVGPTSGVGASGVQQNFEINGRITRKNYAELKNKLEDMDLNNGTFLLNRHTTTEFIKMDHDEWGGPGAEDMWRKGNRALDKFEYIGIPHIATIKRTLVPDNAVYLFTEQSYLGKCYQLQEPVMFVEKRKDVIRFCAQEKLGFTIANVRGVARVIFLG